jgi:hypothetical protein
MSRSSFLFAALLLSVQLQGITQAASVPRGLPQRTIAGVNVVDTQIVRDAHDFVLEHSTSWLYKHVMRSWLFGALIINHNETLRQSVDLEAHAIGALLHDLGWDLSVDSPFVSEDKRFEVDGAIAARQFVRNHEHGRHWDETRVQQVWDSIALHTMASIYNYKEPVVKTVGNGIYTDFAGPLLGIEQSEFKSVVDEFPNTDMADGYNSTLIWLCQHKPLTTIGMLS